MIEPSDEHVDLAVQAFLLAMMRESIKRNPDADEHAIPVWSELSVTNRGILRRAMKTALVGVARRQAQESKHSRV